MRKTTSEVYVCLPHCLEGVPRLQRWEGDSSRAQQPCGAEGQIRVQRGRSSQNLQDRMSKTREVHRAPETLSRQSVKAHWWLPVTEGVQKVKETSEMTEMFQILIVVAVNTTGNFCQNPLNYTLTIGNIVCELHLDQEPP